MQRAAVSGGGRRETRVAGRMRPGICDVELPAFCRRVYDRTDYEDINASSSGVSVEASGNRAKVSIEQEIPVWRRTKC